MNIYTFIACFLLLFSTPFHTLSAYMTHSEETTKESSGQEKKEVVDFLKEPISYLEAVYMDYHNWKIDEGLEKVDRALSQLDPFYKKNPQYEFNNPKLKLKKVYQLKSVLHTLSGMLNYRKSFTVLKQERDKKIASVLEKIEKGEGASDADLEALARDSAVKDREKYFKAAVQELKIAIEVDPDNPSPHFQLGTIYSPLSAAGYSENAEKEFYQAAELSLKEGDHKSAAKAVKSLKSLNPQSPYLKKIEPLMREK